MIRTETIGEGVTLQCGDCRDALAAMEPDSVDSCVTDPPYHLTSIVKRFGAENAAPAKAGKTGAYKRASAGFMGKQWDGGEIAFEPETWAAVLRVLKPGGHLLAFGAAKNFGFMQYAIAQAGFEVRDCLAWLYGSGFPKSHNLGDGWGTALKPAFEPIIMARKPLIGTVAANVALHGTGAINIDGCRVGYENDAPSPATNPLYRLQGGYKHAGNDDSGSHTYSVKGAGQPSTAHKQGRWPANVIHDGSDEVVSAFPETTSGALTRSETATAATGKHGIYGTFSGAPDGKHFPASDGSAARFFYTAKADADDRLGSSHPTVKPVDLMQWLVRLVTPKGGLVLDPFAGTGTTGEAAFREGMRAVLIEREPEYQNDIRRRMALVLGGPEERKRESIKHKLKGKPVDAGPLFGGGDADTRGGADGFTESSRTKNRPGRTEAVT